MLKRLLLAIVGLSCLLTCYAAYVQLFGQLDQLSELDPGLQPQGTSSDRPWKSEPKEPDLAGRVAVQLWGPESWQARADIALYWQNSGVIIYIADYQQAGPYRLQLSPFSLVFVDRPKTAAAQPQIVTLDGNQAELEFDQPVDIVQMGSARPIGGSISGDVHVRTDRGTPDLSDDIDAYTDYLKFRESEQKIWTDAPVRIVQSDAVANSTGIELRLKSPSPADTQKKAPAFLGLREAVLLQDVELQMLAADVSGLFSGAARQTRQRAGQWKKTPVRISCRGPFFYDLENSTARFTRDVHLVRQTAEGEHDQLFCDELRALLFRATPTKSTDEKLRLSLREVHATGEPLRIVSDAQNVNAVGTKLDHDAPSGKTILRGDPEVVASFSGNELHAPELTLTAAGEGRGIATAAGPGRIEIQDMQSGAPSIHARWRQSATAEPQGEGQLLVLRGDVDIDQAEQGKLSAGLVRIWLQRARRPGPGIGTGAGDLAISRIEASENCRVTSAQIAIQAEQLHLGLEENSDTGSQLVAQQTPEPSTRQVGLGRAGRPPRSAREPTHSTPSATARHASGPRPGLRRPPARLSAQVVRATMLRDVAGSELKEVWSEGEVTLWLPPEKPDDQPVVVQGTTLHLERLEHGHRMVVIGKPAHVEMNITVEGQKVGVDQPMGVAWVEGHGMMSLPADTNFDGAALPSSDRLTLRWNSSMFFNGSVAEFTGEVEAVQGQNKLRCEQLEAFLKSPIDLANPKRGDQESAEIDRLVCSRGAEFFNAVQDGEGPKKYEYVKVKTLTIQNRTGQMQATGPGWVRTYTRGPSPLAEARLSSSEQALEQSGAAADGSEGWHLTQVRFADRMDGNRRGQTATFSGRVQVIHSPVPHPRQLVDPNDLPDGAILLSCRRLEVGTRQGAGGVSFHEMVGTGDVDVEANDFYGQAERISYSQQHERLIFEARPGSTAVLFRQPVAGSPFSEARGEKFFYYRREERIKMENGSQLNYREVPPAKKEEKARRR